MTTDSRVSEIARHVAVSAPQTATVQELEDGLSGRDLTPAAKACLRIFLNEAHPTELVDLVLCEATTYKTLVGLASEFLPDDHPNRIFLEQATS